MKVYSSRCRLVASSTVSSAVGLTSSRTPGIGSPLLRDRPCVPLPIRCPEPVRAAARPWRLPTIAMSMARAPTVVLRRCRRRRRPIRPRCRAAWLEPRQPAGHSLHFTIVRCAVTLSLLANCRFLPSLSWRYASVAASSGSAVGVASGRVLSADHSGMPDISGAGPRATRTSHSGRPSRGS